MASTEQRWFRNHVLPRAFLVLVSKWRGYWSLGLEGWQHVQRRQQRRKKDGDFPAFRVALEWREISLCARPSARDFHRLLRFQNDSRRGANPGWEPLTFAEPLARGQWLLPIRSRLR